MNQVNTHMNIEDAPKSFDSNLREFGFLNFLKTEKGKELLKFRFFREPYWIGYTSVLSVTFYALIAILLSFTPLGFLAMPVVAVLFFHASERDFRFCKRLH